MPAGRAISVSNRTDARRFGERSAHRESRLFSLSCRVIRARKHYFPTRAYQVSHIRIRWSVNDGHFYLASALIPRVGASGGERGGGEGANGEKVGEGSKCRASSLFRNIERDGTGGGRDHSYTHTMTRLASLRIVWTGKRELGSKLRCLHLFARSSTLRSFLRRAKRRQKNLALPPSTSPVFPDRDPDHHRDA